MVFEFKVKHGYDDAALKRFVEKDETMQISDVDRAIKLINHGVVEVLSIANGNAKNNQPTQEPLQPSTRPPQATKEPVHDETITKELESVVEPPKRPVGRPAVRRDY